MAGAEQSKLLENLIRKVVREELSPLRGKLEEVVNENKVLRGEIQVLKENHKIVTNKHTDEIDELNQYSRRNNLIIAGIPETDDENLEQIFVSFAQKLIPSFDERDIDVIHRLPRTQATNKPRSIIARIGRRSTKSMLMKLSKVRSNRLDSSQLGFTTDTPIYVNEHLTAKRADLFRKAKQVQKQLRFKYLWTKDGRIYLRKDKGIRQIQIKSVEDLHDLTSSEARTEPPVGADNDSQQLGTQ